MILSIIGPSGSGKDTQANLLCAKFGIPNISTGQLIRGEIEKRSKLGKKLEIQISRGDWANDEDVSELLQKRLVEEDTKNGFIINGYPRTVEQVEILDQILKENGNSLDGVIHFDLPNREIIARMKKQRTVDNTRTDISDEAINARLDSYSKTIQPILHKYQNRKILISIDARPSIEEIHEAIVKSLSERSSN